VEVGSILIAVYGAPRLARWKDEMSSQRQKGRVAATNQEVVRRLVEDVINRGETGLLPALVAEEHVYHDHTGDLYGPEGVRLAVVETRQAFPDLRVTIDELIAAGNRVVRRFSLSGTHAGTFMAVPATGRRVQVSGIGVDRLERGKLVESWICLDVLGLLLQLGVAPRLP
jgi:steroid delta-isomerase-like uncharacterized protein